MVPVCAGGSALLKYPSSHPPPTLCPTATALLLMLVVLLLLQDSARLTGAVYEGLLKYREGMTEVLEAHRKVTLCVLLCTPMTELFEEFMQAHAWHLSDVAWTGSVG